MAQDVYRRKYLWKVYLGIAAVLLLALSTVYTNYLADRLAEGERDKVKIFVNTLKVLRDTSQESLNRDYRPETENLRLVLRDIPVILVDESGEITESYNFSKGTNLIQALASMKKQGLPPIEGEGYAAKIYYTYSRTLTLLTYFPYLQILLLLVFFVLAILGMSAVRRAEQNKVWVGMAKETAHQLGTPISAIIGWIEHLKNTLPDSEENTMVLSELEKDVGRLNLIADRFSKIGSDPELETYSVQKVLSEVVRYMEKRAPKRIAFHLNDSPDLSKLLVRINKHLFAWVVENLLRNALDAMQGEGQININIKEEPKTIHIDVSDTGHGIPQNKFKTVFEPGYSTKKRGWGLGLSLAKRIIEDYHGGKIFVKESKPDDGTTFSIVLPKVA